jgi:glycosyltransferase involved in cell wall biosynthesis
VIAEPDEGISDAFNKGIQFASGDAIMFLNSGDILLEPRYPPSVDKLLNDEPGIDFVYSNMALVENGGGKLTFRKRFENIGRGMKYLHPTMIVRKKVFEQQGDFNKQYKIAMDYDFVVRMEKAGYTGRYIDGDPVVAMSEGGISIGNEKLSLYESYRSLKANNSWTIYTASGFVLRYVLFIMRRLMTTTGLTPLLKYLKRIKHS